MDEPKSVAELMQCDNCLMWAKKLDEGKCDLCVKALANESPRSTLNLHQRINEVRKEVTYLQKKQADKAKGVLWADLVRKLRESMVTHGVMGPYPVKVEVREYTLGPRSEASPTHWERILCSYTFRFLNADDPQDEMLVQAISTGLDNSDKAPGKASTYAAKEAMRKVFLLEEGDDPDFDVIDLDPDVEPERQKAIKRARELADKINPDDPAGEIASLLSYLSEKYTRKVRTVFAIPMDVWPEALKQLEKKAKAAE